MSAACDARLRRTDLIAALAPRLDIEWRAPRRARRRARAHRRAAARARPAPRSAPAGRGSRPRRARSDRRRRSERRVPLRDGLSRRACGPAGPAGRGARRRRPRSASAPDASPRRRPRGERLRHTVARDVGRGIAAGRRPVVSRARARRRLVRARGCARGRGGGRRRPGRGCRPAVPGARARAPRRGPRGGAVVSEMPPGFGVHRWAFVARNRIIAALSPVSSSSRPRSAPAR